MMATLVDMTSQQRLELPERISIGRAATCDVQIDDPMAHTRNSWPASSEDAKYFNPNNMHATRDSIREAALELVYLGAVRRTGALENL